MEPTRTETTRPRGEARESNPRRRCGALSLGGGRVLWRVWAPRAKQVELVLVDGSQRRAIPMKPDGEGYFSHTGHGIPEGQRYAYRLNGGEQRQDPCSLWQPDGVPGPSAVVRTEDFRWTDRDWAGVPREDLVVYELHVGTFTPEGTFESIIPRLGGLRELGVTAIELMPVAQFPGARNWGYDGVLPYAAQNTYGGPHGLQKLVDAAHREGVGVILDVVYNHMGPEANYLHEFGPYFTDKYKTPWGAAMNFDDRDSDAVRDWVVDNARTWLEEFHLDGLRLDAVHAIYDMGALHILREIKEAALEVAGRAGAPKHVIAESDLNDPRVVLPFDRGGHGLDAQWSDDFHHAVHALLTGENRGYYSDFGKPEHLAKVMKTPFLYAGERSPHRGRRHGAPPPADLCGDRFVVCIQNHDQVGNRARGDRFGTLLADPAKQRLAASLLLLAPHVPMLFMGEEYGETRPFPFFCSFRGEDLKQAVRDGRKKEFADFLTGDEQIPDPNAAETFESAKLSWAWPEGTVHAGLRKLYGDLLSARQLWSAMKDFSRRETQHVGGVLELVRGGTLRAYFNLRDEPTNLPAGAAGDGVPIFSSEASRYGGPRRDVKGVRELLPYECVVFAPDGWHRFV
jgi:maltooligosyltrehalose trehalohydrolase